ncbi:hypothetical protein STEG23_021125 [Scotinomys teguina]
MPSLLCFTNHSNLLTRMLTHIHFHIAVFLLQSFKTGKNAKFSDSVDKQSKLGEKPYPPHQTPPLNCTFGGT